ncbi:related to riboflavin biosynthesis protein RIB7 [Cephalotrichum gorgonifer]|uniref:2,5-diamino-6-ribosylamino-4(3H)-pyrimidinone 5'-phosphate reductase n=1 Tax=Cephalotrichum gorgonifer TaxID=2041049 RepID=A0AAE8MQ77_9PEZI|nr:related to riboflavin biosynthesis protein RIB7 [Cephalotrichum gorgonifer]
MSEQLTFPEPDARKLTPYLPPPNPAGTQTRAQGSRPFVTLTFATSLDSSLSLAPGVRTRLSGPESKAMTHYLRSRHDAICVGVGTAVADDPALNCRIAGCEGQQPRPIVLDPHGRWAVSAESKVLETARAARGKAPFVITAEEATLSAGYADAVEDAGGKIIRLGTDGEGRFAWRDVLGALWTEGIRSVMVEGGGGVINELLDPANHELIDSVIVTIAPTWLGKGGVVVSPERVHEGGNAIPAARLSDVLWHPLGEDVVLCGRL